MSQMCNVAKDFVQINTVVSIDQWVVKQSTKMLSSTAVFKIHNISWAPNQHIRMISDHVRFKIAAEISALPSQKYITFESIIKKETIIEICSISQYYCFYCICDQIYFSYFSFF